MVIKSKKILSEISAGELLDKISILEIKLDKVKDKTNLEEINKEYKILKEVQDSNMSKLGEDGKPIYNEYGKVMKGPKYFKPDLSKFLK